MSRPVNAGNEPRTLVFCSAGGHFSQLAWLANLQDYSGFDVAIVDYSDGLAPPPAGIKYFLRNKDFKVPNFLLLAREEPSLLEHDLFFFIDDDIVMSADNLAQWRKVIVELQLDLSQPALTPNSKTDWPHVKLQPSFEVKHDQFVEIQCFALSRRALRVALPYFFMVKTGTGLDVALYNLAQRVPLRTAVVHSVQITHPRRPEDETVRRQFDQFAKFNTQMNVFMNFCFERPTLFDDLVESSRLLGDTRPRVVHWLGILRFVLARIRRVVGRRLSRNR